MKKSTVFLFLLFIQFTPTYSIPTAFGQESEEEEFQEITADEKKSMTEDHTAMNEKHEHSFNGLYHEFVFTRSWLLISVTIIAGLFIVYKQFHLRYILLLASLFFLGFRELICPGPVGAAVRVFTDPFTHGGIALGQLVILLPILALTLIFGRSFCGGVCPLGGLQEFLCIRSKSKRVDFKIERRLRQGQIAFFLVLVTTSIIIGRYSFEIFEPFKAIFTMKGSQIQWAVAALFFPICLFVFRPFCRYLCPLALWLRLASFRTIFKIKIDSPKCTNCGICQKKCPMSVIGPLNQIENSNCIRCGECIDNCKRGAISCRM